MIKNTFILLPIILLLTACTGNKILQIDDNNKVKEKSTIGTSNLSYENYKASYETGNEKLKNRPHSKYESIISKEEYDKLVYNPNENK